MSNSVSNILILKKELNKFVTEQSSLTQKIKNINSIILKLKTVNDEAINNEDSAAKQSIINSFPENNSKMASSVDEENKKNINQVTNNSTFMAENMTGLKPEKNSMENINNYKSEINNDPTFKDKKQLRPRTKIKVAHSTPEILENKIEVEIPLIFQQNLISKPQINKQQHSQNQNVTPQQRNESIIQTLQTSNKMLSINDFVNILKDKLKPSDFDLKIFKSAVSILLNQMVFQKRVLFKIFIDEKKCNYYGLVTWLDEYGKLKDFYISKLNEELLFSIKKEDLVINAEDKL